MTRDPLTLAIALENRRRHGVTLDGTCAHCLPPGTAWPCQPFQAATAVIDRLAEFDPPPVDLGWLDGRPRAS